MTDKHPSSYRTSLLFILLTLIAGTALGWLLRDKFGMSISQATAPTAVITPAIQSPPTPASAPPSATLIPAPTYTPRPQPTTAPIEPALEPSATLVSPTAPTDTLLPPVGPPPATAVPATSEIVAYAGHIVAQNETLATIAANGGSTPDLLAQYNLLDGPPQPGRALIVPQIAGQSSTLESEPILIQRGRADKPWVALTLDAGASAAPVPRMLQTLRDHNVHVTFFLTGKWIKENPDLARQIVADGHEIGNHTFNHPDLTRLGVAAIRKELTETEELMQQTAGVTSRPFFRPPYGAYDKLVLQIVEGEGYLPIYWTLDSLDSVGDPKTPEFLLERITGKLTPEQLHGAIILAHCGSEPTADALPQILDRFAEMGFEVKKVSEVLGS
jgi:peptidoglycan/xylan/chitin deacetylase (PgdA/CDA1 family)